MKIVIAAVPGAGKTTVLNFVKKKIPSAKIVHTGDLAFEIAKKRFKIKNRDEMRKIFSTEQQRALQDYIYKKISKMKSKIIFIDTHLSIKTPNGYFPGLAERAVRLIKPDKIVVLEFDPKDVLERRMKDPTRQRDIETEEEIEEHQRMNRQFASTAASIAECSVEIINLRYKQKKPFEHAEKAAEEIIKLIKR